jgi:hypothetical protein
MSTSATFETPTAEPPWADALLRDFAETEAAVQNGTAIIYSTPEDLFAAWDAEDE